MLKDRPALLLLLLQCGSALPLGTAPRCEPRRDRPRLGAVLGVSQAQGSRRVLLPLPEPCRKGKISTNIYLSHIILPIKLLTWPKSLTKLFSHSTTTRRLNYRKREDIPNLGSSRGHKINASENASLASCQFWNTIQSSNEKSWSPFTALLFILLRI